MASSAAERDRLAQEGAVAEALGFYMNAQGRVVGGGSSARISAFFAQRLATVKWITAAATLVLIVTAWLL